MYVHNIYIYRKTRARILPFCATGVMKLVVMGLIVYMEDLVLGKEMNQVTRF